MASSINASTSGAGGVITTADNSGVLNLQTAGTTAVTVDASQNVGIGTSTVASGRKFQVEASGDTVQRINSGGASNGVALEITNAGTVRGTIGNGAGAISGGSATTMAVQAVNELVFASGGYSEKMRLDSSGNLLLGATAAYSGTPRMFIKNIAGNANNTILQMQCQSTSIANSMINFYDGNNTFMGQIYVNPGSASTVYATSSDYRLKENAEPITGAKDFILALQPKTWTWKRSGLKSTGFIAHEVQAVAKESVLGTKDEIDADGNPVYQSMQAGSSEIIANLVSFVQELNAKVDAQAAEIKALKGAA